jgi:alanine racemase
VNKAVTSNPPTTAASDAGASAGPTSMPTHPCWVEVSLTALRNNLHAVQSYVHPETNICAVIKSDAYGHGMAGCASALQSAGAKWFAVSTTDEGIALRRARIRERILILAGFWSGQEDAIVQHQLTPVVWERSQIELLENAAEKLKPQQRVPVHLKINTGMNRLGADLKDLPPIYQAIRSASHVLFEGIFSHFAASEVVDLPHGNEQLQHFYEAIAQAETFGLVPPVRHMANSAAIAGRRESWFNMVRPGLALYGYCLPLASVVSGCSVSAPELAIKPALSWKTRVLQVRDVAAGEQVGYSSGHVTQSSTKVAVLAVGYGDGLSRRLSSRGRVIVRNSYAAILGNVSMNLIAADVTRIPGVEAGDEVTIIGETSSCKITAWEHADLAATIPYEILCNIAGRLPRKYVE